MHLVQRIAEQPPVHHAHQVVEAFGQSGSVHDSHGGVARQHGNKDVIEYLSGFVRAAFDALHSMS